MRFTTTAALLLLSSRNVMAQSSSAVNDDSLAAILSEANGVFTEVTQLLATAAPGIPSSIIQPIYSQVESILTKSRTNPSTTMTTSPSPSSTSSIATPTDVTSSATLSSSAQTSAAAAAATPASNNLAIILGAVLGALALFLLALLIFLLCRRRRSKKRRSLEREGSLLRRQNMTQRSHEHLGHHRGPSRENMLGHHRGPSDGDLTAAAVGGAAGAAAGRGTAHHDAPPMTEHPAFRNGNVENPFTPAPPPPRRTAPNSRPGLTDGTVPGQEPFIGAAGAAGAASSSPKQRNSILRKPVPAHDASRGAYDPLLHERASDGTLVNDPHRISTAGEMAAMPATAGPFHGDRHAKHHSLESPVGGHAGTAALAGLGGAAAGAAVANHKNNRHSDSHHAPFAGPDSPRSSGNTAYHSYSNSPRHTPPSQEAAAAAGAGQPQMSSIPELRNRASLGHAGNHPSYSGWIAPSSWHSSRNNSGDEEDGGDGYRAPPGVPGRSPFRDSADSDWQKRFSYEPEDPEEEVLSDEDRFSRGEIIKGHGNDGAGFWNRGDPHGHAAARSSHDEGRWLVGQAL